MNIKDVKNKEQVNNILENDNVFSKFLKDNANFLNKLVVKKVPNHLHYDYDDLFQIASLALHRSLKTFDPSKSSLSTYSYVVINNELNKFYKDKKIREEHETSIENLLNFNEEDGSGGNEYREELFYDPKSIDNSETDLLNKMILKEYLNKQSDKTKKVFTKKVVDGKTLKSIAKEMNLTWNQFRWYYYKYFSHQMKNFCEQELMN